MTAHHPSDPAAEAVSALREALIRAVIDPIHGRDAAAIARGTTEDLIEGPLAPLLADIAALRTRAEEVERERDDARCVGEANARAADANLEAYEAAEARADALAAALKPFADIAGQWDCMRSGNPSSPERTQVPLDLGMLRAAARALKTEGTSDA